MVTRFITVYTALCVLASVITLYLGRKAFKSEDDSSQYLALIAAFVAVGNLAYLFSALLTDRGAVSSFSSVYFICTDWMLVYTVKFAMVFTGVRETKLTRGIKITVKLSALVDSIIMASNRFTEIALGYVFRDTPIASYSYDLKPLFYFHLGLIYACCAIILTLYICKSLNTTPKHKKQYIHFIGSTAIGTALHTLYLFGPKDGLYTLPEWTGLMCSVGLYYIYRSFYVYRRDELLENLSAMVFEELKQGVALFDYRGELYIENGRAEELLPKIYFREKMPMNEFVIDCGLPLNRLESGEVYIVKGAENGRTVRCSYKPISDQNGRSLGNVFLISDATEGIDTLTGFYRWESFEKLCGDHPDAYLGRIAVAVFDIISLSDLNKREGRDTGDKRIRELAELMRREMSDPNSFHLVRGIEADLCAVCMNMTESGLKAIADRIVADFEGELLYGLADDPDCGSVFSVIDTASTSLMVKKLLNNHSHRSQALTSLVKALEECDSDTEEHVKRTQKMGALLGERIGLSDSQQSDLSLLCLLHDIGKIGIPLEILNKPGKLSSDEWAALRTHPEKGSEIAKSSRELAHIADMILYHHERWDGYGYPVGLRGEEIPVLSRIICIVDAYDAMVNRRAYKPAYPVEKARGEITRCAGTQFDPKMAEEFLKMLDEHPELAKGQYVDEQTKSLPKIGISDSTVSLFNSYPVTYSRYVVDSEFNLVDCDEEFERLTGYSKADVEAHKLRQRDLIPREELTNYLTLVGSQLAQSPVAYIEHRIKRKDGRIIYVFCYGKRYFDSAVKDYRTEILIFDAAKTHYAMGLEKKYSRNPLTSASHQ